MGDVIIEVCDVNDVVPQFINTVFIAGNVYVCVCLYVCVCASVYSMCVCVCVCAFV